MARHMVWYENLARVHVNILGGHWALVKISMVGN
jgi:hypothetical protein